MSGPALLGVLTAWFLLVLSVVEASLVARIEREQRNRTGFEAFQGYVPSRKKIRRVRIIGWLIALLVPPAVWLGLLAA